MSDGAITVIVLAAGHGTRFRAAGGAVHKLDALLAGRAVLDHVLAAVAGSGLNAYVVRPWDDAVTAGMGDSIARGVRATAASSGWLILPGDLPLVRAGSLRRVAAALGRHGVVVPRYRGLNGHPVAFGRGYFDALASLSGDAGAASVVRIARSAGDATDLPVNDGGILRDVDTPGDLRRAARLLRRRGVPAL